MKEITRLPNHIAFILDGNGRWAEKRGLPRLEGHRTGTETTHSIISYLDKLHIKYVTLYSFSTENWNRPQEEVSSLLTILEESLGKDTFELHQNNVRLRHLGRLDRTPKQLKQVINWALKLTKNNTGMNLSFAFDYGGRLEILDAVRNIIAKGISPNEVDEKLFSRYLYTAGLPDVDLVIRTGGELRLSNFLLWQSAYSEYYFSEVLWPDFNTEEVEKALRVYSQRQRRFGSL
ncbi:MAG: di-trans,poly-cis-decaprenylcistransferase [Dehalococcoidales bacterium]|nr:di-trans,poly-cis-decaprenylcistransferase [Dehalococcoidales bacterium]